MAREKMITRTLKATEVKAMICNTKTATVETRFITVNGTFKDVETLKNAVQVLNIWSMADVVVMVEKIAETEKLYGMPESLFMMYAKELPPRTTTEIE